MTERKRDSHGVLKRKSEKVGAVPSPNADRNQAATNAVTYDALDYRLMATFPASDAVAQY